jgi:cold shock CspA family protein
MKKIVAALAAAVMVVAMVSMVFAADMQKGTIKSVDAKKGTVVFCAEGGTKDMTLKADKSIDLGAVNAGEKVEVTVEKDMMKSMKAMPAAKRKVNVGC